MGYTLTKATIMIIIAKLMRSNQMKISGNTNPNIQWKNNIESNGIIIAHTSYKETNWKKVRKTKKIGNKKNGIAFNIDASSDTNKFTPHNLVNKEIWKTRKGINNFYLQLPMLLLQLLSLVTTPFNKKKLQTCFQTIENTTRSKREK